MTQPNQEDKDNFLYPHSRYHGENKPENVAFNAKLQQFAQKIGYITNFVASGKLSPEEAYKQIKALWKELKRSKKELGINNGEPLEKK